VLRIGRSRQRDKAQAITRQCQQDDGDQNTIDRPLATGDVGQPVHNAAPKKYAALNAAEKSGNHNIVREECQQKAGEDKSANRPSA
jgi:hypothetical protein